MKIKSWFKKQTKKKARIYILPTRMGGYLNGLIFLMFLLSLGYSNNLLLIFTLILFGFNLLWVIQTHYYLHALRPNTVMIHDSFAGENAVVEIGWKSTPDGPHQWDIILESDMESFSLGRTGLVAFPKRGVWDFFHLQLRTEMPFGLYRAWIYLPIKSRAYVYPEKLKVSPPIQVFSSQDEGEISTLLKGADDYFNLSSYLGEESRKIYWKRYARSGELLIKEGEEFKAPEIRFHLSSENKDKEWELSKMATQMVQCLNADTPFMLETPRLKTKHDKSERHLKECLRELSQC